VRDGHGTSAMHDMPWKAINILWGVFDFGIEYVRASGVSRLVVWWASWPTAPQNLGNMIPGLSQSRCMRLAMIWRRSAVAAGFSWMKEVKILRSLHMLIACNGLLTIRHFSFLLSRIFSHLLFYFISESTT
jgi:hypothetical protein